MWLSRLFTSSRSRRRPKKSNVAPQRRLCVERLEDRRLLTITISGTIDVSNLPCATQTTNPNTHVQVASNVPVSGALVTASYTVGANTFKQNVYTDTHGHYKIDLNDPNAVAVGGATVTMTIVAQSQQQTAGLPAYVVSETGFRSKVLTYQRF